MPWEEWWPCPGREVGGEAGCPVVMHKYKISQQHGVWKRTWLWALPRPERDGRVVAEADQSLQRRSGAACALRRRNKRATSRRRRVSTPERREGRALRALWAGWLRWRRIVAVLVLEGGGRKSRSAEFSQGGWKHGRGQLLHRPMAWLRHIMLLNSKE